MQRSVVCESVGLVMPVGPVELSVTVVISQPLAATLVQLAPRTTPNALKAP